MERIDPTRRCLGMAAMTIAAARLGLLGKVEAKEANQRAPRELAAIGAAAEWLNSPRLTPSRLSGKVVLVDFWTYSCINWLRTLPYVRAWTQRYSEAFVLIGVHTPEFAFERDIDNVRRAVRQLKIEYPVVIDNDYSIWRAFKNQYWPALFFLDGRGRIRHHHFGEGEYQKSELAIKRLLTEAGVSGLPEGVVAIDGGGVEAAPDWGNLKSPETYVGYDRTQNFASRGGVDMDRRRVYSAPSRLAPNQWALAGEWTMGKQAVVLGRPEGRIVYRFHARDLHLVMAPPRRDSPVRFRVSIDGHPPGIARGVDVDEAGNGTILEPRMYQLIRQPKPILDRQFEIQFLDAGAEAFAFTFG
jgi:thiol-disulfide isomerase/thioredoxin